MLKVGVIILKASILQTELDFTLDLKLNRF